MYYGADSWQETLQWELVGRIPWEDLGIESLKGQRRQNMQWGKGRVAVWIHFTDSSPYHPAGHPPEILTGTDLFLPSHKQADLAACGGFVATIT